MSLAIPTLAEKQFLAMMKACLDSGGVTSRFIIEAATRELECDEAFDSMLEGDEAFNKKPDDVVKRGAKKISKLERKAGSAVKKKGRKS